MVINDEIRTPNFSGVYTKTILIILKIQKKRISEGLLKLQENIV